MLLAEHFHGLLTNQDQGGKRLHATVQNKVSKREAQVLQAKLDGVIAPRPFRFRGLALHRYLGGPWELIQEVAFRGKEKA